MARITRPGQIRSMADVVRYLTLLSEEIERELTRLEAANKTPYLVENFTASRSFDAGTADLAATKEFLATMAFDLKRSGKLR